MPRESNPNRADFWRDPDFNGVSQLHARFTTHEYQPHVHDTLVIAATERGGAVIESRGVAAEAPPAALFLLNPDEPQSAWMGRSRRWEYRASYMTGSALRDAAQDLGMERLPPFARNKLTDPILANDFLAWHRASACAHDPLQRHEQLIGLLGRVMALQRGKDELRSRCSPADRAAFGKVTALMREQYAANLSLEELAAPIRASKYRLIRLFTRAVGLTPHRYLAQLRLGAARRHLLEGDSIAEAAARAGFFDQNALPRHFKLSYGITPAQFSSAVRRQGGAGPQAAGCR
jgi:AraC-like DNA-binding protein